MRAARLAGIVEWINGGENDSPNVFAVLSRKWGGVHRKLLTWLIVPVGPGDVGRTFVS